MDRRNMLKGAIAAGAAFSATQAKAKEAEIVDAQYVVVELMGYKKLAGRLSQGPAGMLQIEVAVEGGFVTQFFNAGSVYRITVVDEAVCRQYAKAAADPLPALELEMAPVQGRLYHDDDECVF